jgi:hypothetical protein
MISRFTGTAEFLIDCLVLEMRVVCGAFAELRETTSGGVCSCCACWRWSEDAASCWHWGSRLLSGVRSVRAMDCQSRQHGKQDVAARLDE